jgi:hypothetical protein
MTVSDGVSLGEDGHGHGAWAWALVAYRGEDAPVLGSQVSYVGRV